MGGSAGARMAAWLSSFGTKYFGEVVCPKAGTVIMQYTGLSEVNNDPPFYENCGTDDWIVNYKVMNNRINKIKNQGTDTMIEIFKGLPHGFWLGEGTIVERWINNAINFWKKQIK